MKLPSLKIGDFIPKFPIIQGGMAVRVSTHPLVGAVAKAGGIGVIGATGMKPGEITAEIEKARQVAPEGIVGVNIMYAARQFKDLVHEALHSQVDIIFTGAGFSREIFRWCKETKTAVVPIVSSLKAAKLAERSGAAAVVAEGAEAGGHLGTDRSIKDIIAEIVQAVSIPVIAAGGITTGKDMAEMFRAGANGVQMATRFVLSEECPVADEFKQLYLKAEQEDVVIIKSPVGLPGRAINNGFAKLIGQGQAPEPEHCWSCLKDCTGEYCIMQALINAKNGLVNQGVVFAGKNVSALKEILSVPAIFDRLLQEVAAI